MLSKISQVPVILWMWLAMITLLVLHLLWCHFVAYPASFERKLRQGKLWVYIPLRWRGLHKFNILLLSRLLVLGIAGIGAALLVNHTGRREPLWITGFSVVLFLGALRLDAFWTSRRYRQQEDAYYLLHDELHAKLEQEGKDFTDAQCRNLAIYQHQQRLRKADESGKLIAAMRQEAKRSRQITAPQQASVNT
jgi:hypothetical protein